MTQLVGRLGRNDVKLIGRDSFLLFMFLFALIIALVLRFGLPWLNTALAENGVLPNVTFGINSLAELYPMIVAYMAIYTGALLVGTVFGFVLLDEKDDNTIKAMLVTPIPLRQYVLYRVGLPAILAFFIIMGTVLVIDQALLPLGQMLLIVAGGSFAAPIISLFFATFAENKVQGFAYSKFGGISGWAFLIGWFIPEPWQWLIGLFPPFWVGKAYWMALEGHGLWWVVLIIGVVLQIGLILWLLQRFNKVAYR
ncbi:MAG: ABC transporter permease [Chloroflexales bacterium]|nr:ABC transporter permease [Chloroflexales bacterium]